jgi:PAS domain-containing protein
MAAKPDYLTVPEISRFTSRRGKVHCEVGDAADGKQESENAADYPAVPPAGTVPARSLRARSAVAVGGLAGNNAHGAGFLEALRRSGKVPQLVSCTSGQILHVAEWLKGTDIQAYFENAMKTTQPFGQWTDANLIYKQMSAGAQLIRPSVFEFPTDMMANISRSWMKAVSDPANFSLFRELSNVQPARSLVPAFPPDFYKDIAEVLDKSEVGVMFNAYDIDAGHEYVYLNPAAQRLTGKKIGQHETRSWIEYRPVNPDTVEQALYLYQYGFNSGTKTVDGAYVRDVILSEIPSENNQIDRIAAVRPQPDNWLGDAPQSNVELQSLQTQVAFNATYIGERERIRLMNRLSGQLKWDTQPKPISILELPLCEPRTWWDYVVESDLIFRSAFWRGQALVNYL